MNGDTEMNVGMALSVCLFVIGAISAFVVAILLGRGILFVFILLAVAVSSLYLYYISATVQKLQDLSREFMNYERTCEKREERNAEETQALLRKLIELKEQELALLHSENHPIVDDECTVVECFQIREEQVDVQESCVSKEEPKQEETSVEIDAASGDIKVEESAVVESEAKTDEKSEELLCEEEPVAQPESPNDPVIDCTSNVKRATKEDLEHGFIYNKSKDKALDILRKEWKR